MNAVTFYSELFESALNNASEYNMFVIQSVATCSALIWLLFRAWQTLWKPVPELISILGVEVPDPPEVTLAGITSDSVTLHWSRLDAQKPASKYLIQVNGLNVGETSWMETAITITGLRPVHYYNIRVISVGSNNFQAGSLVIRVRTYGKDGRPALDSSYSSPNSAHEDIFTSSGDETSDDRHGVSVEATTISEDLTNTHRDFNSLASAAQNSGQRKNNRGKTNKRKQSQSIESTESTPSSLQKTWGSKESVHQLTMQLESLNRDREKIAKEITKEIEDLKEQYADICNERDNKRQILKEKEEASEKLKKEVNLAERLNRQAQMKKSQKEKLLKEKLAERLKMKEDMKRWKREIEEMKLERGRWRVEKEKAEKKNQVVLAELKQEIKKCQASLNIIEEEIRLKGSQIKKLEKNRKRLSACKNGEELRLRDEQEDRDWDVNEKALSAKLNTKSQQLRELASCLHQQQAYLAALQNRSSTIYQGYYSSYEYDSNEAQVGAKIRSNLNQNCQPISPTPRHSVPCSTFIAPGTFSSQSPVFASGPYIDMRNESANEPESELISHTTDEDYHSLNAGAPLSPTASLLLPSNIFADDDPPSNLSELVNSSEPAPTVLLRNHESQTTCSTSYSPSLSTSPLISSQQLPTYGSAACGNVENDLSFPSPRLSRSVIGSAKPPRNLNSKGFRNLFLPKLKLKDAGPDGSISGSIGLKHSTTLPQFLDEEVTASDNKNRRNSFTSSWTGFLHKNSTVKELSTGNDSFLTHTHKSNKQRPNLGLTGSCIDDSELHDAHSSSPYARSVVSFDLPRPSTDSAPFGWGPAQDNITNRNSPLSTDWSHYSSNHNSTKSQTSWPSNFSKRTSSKNGFNSAFLSRLANEDDDFLPPSEVMTNQFSQPSAIGTIGTQLLSSNHTSITPKLNPEAPAFQKFSINDYQEPKMENYRNDETDPLHSSAIKNTKTSHQSKSKSQSPSPISHDSTISRKNILENHEVLDHETNGTPLESISSLNGKGKDESSLQRLLRKGSSSKFSISSFRSKDTSIFSGKRSSTTYSDRNPSFEREGSIHRASGDFKSRSLDSRRSSHSSGKNHTVELTQNKDKDHAFKEGRLSVSWGRFGFKGKKSRESLEIIGNDDNDENTT